MGVIFAELCSMDGVSTFAHEMMQRINKAIGSMMVVPVLSFISHMHPKNIKVEDKIVIQNKNKKVILQW